jgi:hypothetical protein
MTRGRIAGIVAAVVVAAVLGVVLGARGSGSPVAAAATKTSATSARLAFSLTLRSPRLATAVQVHGSGNVDGPTADITIDDSGAPAVVPTSLHVLLLQQGGHELAFVHATPMPSLAGGKDWIEVDLSQLASSHGVNLARLAARVSGETPTQILDLLRGAGATVTDLGPATVGGVSTTHYRVAVDAAEVAQLAGLPLIGAGVHATRSVPVNVWIGKADGLVHRVAVSLKHGARSVTFAATLSDYGTSLSVSAPPSSDVLNLTGLLSGAGAGMKQPFG